MSETPILNEMTEPEKAYLAGIVDGEGSVCVTRVRRKENRSGFRFYATVQITNTSKQLLDWIQKITGLGKIYEISENGMGAKRKGYRWKIKHSQSRQVLESILPYLIIKKDSAINCIEFCKISGLGKNYSNYPLEEYEYFWKCSSELNKRGELIDENVPVASTQGREMAVMRAAKRVRPPNKIYETHEEMLAARRKKYRKYRDAKINGIPLEYAPLSSQYGTIIGS